MFTNWHKAIQFLRFGIVGIGNTGIDFITFFLLTKAGVPYLLAQVISYSAGVMNSFVFNRKWTFQVTRKMDILEVVKFIIMNGLSLFISFGLLFLIHQIMHLDLWLSKIVATGGGIVVNFLGSKLWVFAERTASNCR